MESVPERKSVLAQWRFEIFSIFWSLGALAAMIGLLAHFDGRVIFDGGVITLNTIVSMLSMMSKVCLLAAISSCVSQEGWVLFSREPRRLYDFELVSQASRGPLGSLKLLWSWRMQGGMIVRLGALVTFLALAVDPFSQQIVQFAQNWREERGGSFPRAVRYTKGAQYSGLRAAYEINMRGRVDLPSNDSYMYVAPDFAMQGAIEFSLTSTREAVEQQASPDCGGNRCRSDSFESLAVCSQCVDVNPRLRREENGEGYQLSEYRYDQSSAQRDFNTTIFRLPNGLYLDNIDDDYGVGGNMVYMATSGTSDPDRTVAMSDIDTLIWSQSMIKTVADPFGESGRLWPDFEVQAFECALYYCVNEYSMEINNGTVSQKSSPAEGIQRNPDSWQPTGSNPNNDQISEKLVKSLAYHPADSLIPRTDLQLVNNAGQQWNITKDAVDGISYFMQHLFAVCLDRESMTNGVCADAVEEWGQVNGFYLTVSGQQEPLEEYRPNVAKVLFQSSDFDGMFDRIALGMSNALRSGDEDATANAGTILHPTTVYNVDWRWFALPAIIELIGLIFFALAVWSTASTGGAVPLWKSSGLAVLSHGVAAFEALQEAKTPEEQERKAKDTNVLLRTNTALNPPSSTELREVRQGQKNYILIDDKRS